MSGLGSFIQGAFSGYEYGEQNKDRKTRRQREEENHEWTRESRDQTRDQWRRQNRQNDRDWAEQQRIDRAAAEERSVLAAAGAAAADSYNSGPSDEVVPVEVTPPTTPEQEKAPASDAPTVSTRGSGPDDGTRGRGVIDAARAEEQAAADAQRVRDAAGFAGSPQQLQTPAAPGAAPTAPRPEAPAPQRQSQLAAEAAAVGPDIQGYRPGQVDPRLYQATQGQGRSVIPSQAPQQPQTPARMDAGPAQVRPSQQPAPPAADPRQGPTRAGMAANYGAPFEVQRMAQDADRLERMLATGVYPDVGTPITDQDRQVFTARLQQADGELKAWAEGAAGPGGTNYSADAVWDGSPRQQAADGTRTVMTGGLRPPAPSMQQPPAVPRGAPDARPVTAAPGRIASPIAMEGQIDTPPMRTQGPGRPRAPAPTISTADAQRVAPAAQPAPSPAGGPDAMAASVAAQTTEDLHAQATTAPPDQGGAPSVQIAAETAPTEGRGVLGKDDPVKTTPAQRERAAKSFLDHYAEVAVPQIVEYYARQGNLEKAEAFETWAKSREARGTMESWAKAVHAASIGDDDAFLDHLGDTYNSFDDGYEVVRDGSGFTKDEAGNITGAKVIFKNTQTGETFERVFEGQSDLIEMGIYAMSPEKIFEHLFNQLGSAAEIAAEQRKFERDIAIERVKRDMDGPSNNAALIASAKRALAEQMIGTWAQLSPEEQNALAIQYVRDNRAAGAQLNQPAAPPPYMGD